MFDSLLLVACVCIVAALTLYFFYWNRFVAFLIGQTVRILYWNQEASSIWVEVGSIHFSLISGRILFKDLRYHSSNQTIKIVKGQIQWRYWIRRPTSEEEISSARSEDVKHSARLWSCRIQISFQGVEWFLYNRTAAYDNIISQMERNTRPTSRSSSNRRFLSRFTRQAETASPFYPPSSQRRVIRLPNFITNALNWLRLQLPNLDPKDLLPLGIDVQTGVIILGNPSTPSLLVAEFQHAFGTYGIVPSKSKFDLYKQVLGIKFQRPLVRLIKNEDYVDPMAVLGGHIHHRIRQHATLRKPSFYQPHRAFVKIWRQFRLYSLVVDFFATRRAQHQAQGSVPGFKKAKGAEDDTPIGIDFSAHEYAIERKILEAPALELTYYIDAAGEVPEECEGPHGAGKSDTSPEWGFDIVIYGGTLRYGPWADRQRAELQRIFFPPTYQNNEVSPELRPGAKRAWGALQVFVELRDDTTLYIPFREASKDWQWDGQVEVPQRPRRRESAFISVTVGDQSSINYVMPMFVGPSGYESTLEAHLDAVTVTSSLNDIRLISGESCRVRGEMPVCINWNGERTWTFSVFLRQPILFLLRDHINMFTDLGKDWVSGPPTDYQKFIPMIYDINLEMHHFVLNLYANDQNIIDKPLIREENAIISLRGPHLKNSTTIPSNVFRPESTSIPFAVIAPDLSACFFLPRWNTHALHTLKDGIPLFTTELFQINASYRYFAEVHDENVEQLKLDFSMKAPTYRMYGWSIRYFMVLRDNYLGSFTHFQTLSEYLDKRKQNQPIGDPIGLKYRPGKSNMLQTQILLHADLAVLLMPTTLVGCAGSTGHDITFAIPDIQLQFRMHDYYMEMSLKLDTARGYIREGYQLGHALSQSRTTPPKDILMIDGVDITANRLFGPQPRTATYVCIWEIAIGCTKASMSARQAQILTAALTSFRLNFVDLVNAPATDFVPTSELDVSFYKITIKTFEATWKAGHATLLVQLSEGLKFNSNDLGTRQYRKVSSLRVPDISTKVLLAPSAERNLWLEAAEFVCDAYLDIYAAPIGHHAFTRAQLAFIEEQDKGTGRARKLFERLRQRSRSPGKVGRVSHRNSVYLPQPSLPSRVNGFAQQRPTQYQPPPQPRPASWRLSTLATMSDSEGEEGVSEADRDARLARTRTSTPVPRVQEEDIMSSGDESDDADLTEGEYSEDDWSDIGDSSDEGANALMSFYSNITRHYAANRSDPPGLWEGPLFIPTRGRAPFIRRDAQDNLGSECSNHGLTISPEQFPKDNDLTTFRLKCRNAAKFLCTPLILPAVIQFEEDMRNVASGPQMCMDSLLANCISRISSNDTTTPKSSVANVSIPHVSFQLVQNIAMSNDGHPNVFQSMHSATMPSNLDILTLISLDVSGISFSGLFSNDLSTFKASVDQLNTEFEISTDRRTLQAANPKEVVFKLSITSPSFGQSSSGINVNTGSMSISIGHQAPELVSAASIALLPLLSQARRFSKGLKSFDLMAKRSIMGTLLNASKDKPVIDPLSTIQPSYLVQFGIPHSLRADVSFRFLYHLRNCITTATGNHCDDIGLKDLVASTEARLALLDQDASNISDLTALDPTLFGVEATRDATLQKSRPRLNSIHVCIVTAKIAVRAPDGPSSELVIKNTGVEWQSQSLDLVQFNFSNPSGASQTSLRSKTSKVVKKAVALLSFGDVDLEIAPHLMDFAQHVLRVKKQIGGKNDSPSNRILQDIADRSSNYVSKFSHHEIIAFIRRLRIRAAAENLAVVMGMNGIQTSTTVLVNPSQRSRPINSNLLFDEIYLQARSPANPAKESAQDVLASIALTGGRLSVILRPESGSRTDLKLIFCLSGLKLHVPRSALRLYRFVEEWRADYLPGIEATVNTLLSEYKSAPIKELSPTPSRRSRRHPIVQLHGQVDHFEISLQVMHGTWLSWQVQNTLAYFQSSSAALNPSYSFGLQTASMIVSVSSKPNAQDVAPSSRLKLVLPPVSLGGQSDGYNVNMCILLRFIDIKVKPSHWDTILAVQQKFGQDFNDLVALTQKTRRKDPSIKPLTKGKNNFQYIGQFKMQGFRIGLEGVSSIVYLECQDINGGISSEEGWKWDVGLSDLALSLAPRMTGKTSTTFSRNHRSAFVTIDFKVGGSNIDGRDGKSISLSVTKTHAVMQPSSIGEFGDFIDNLQAEMLERQEQRALQLAAFKEKTQSILQTFDVNINDAQFQKTSWINDLVVSVSVRNIGVAFPLSHDEELQLPRTRNRESVAVRAFLFSIKSIEFESHRGETGQAMMKRLSFQFVSQFRQSSPEDFAAENHSTSNCLLYPEMQAQLRSSSVGLSRKFWIKADVNGFVLDIDSTIPSYVFALIDVYRQGKDRVDRLSAIAPRTPLSPPSTPDSAKPSPEKHYTTMPTSNIFMKLTFRSGKVRLHSGSASDQFKKRISAGRLVDLSDDLALDLGVEVFNLPVVSVWGEYRATPASQKISMSEHTPSDLLVFNSTVSSSQNTLRPTLLPFMTELVNQIETRMRKVSSRVSRPPSLALAVPSGAPLPEKDPNVESMSSMQICFSLRIDQSKLELTCQPDVNVVAGLHWESGGFVLNVSPGARKVAFSGSVGGLTVGLKHGFLSEDCVKLDAHNLSFSVSFAKTDVGLGDIVNSISIVLDTEFSGGVRFSRLQDILCFKAVWLDRIPILNNSQLPTELNARPASSQAMETAPKRGFSTSILLRIRQIALDIDLGQSITRISLELNQTIFRTQLTDLLNEVFFYVGDVSTTAQGNISGRLQVPSCIFQTIRRIGGPLQDINGPQRMLELKLTSGALVAVLESEHQKLLHYHAEPLEVEIYDDWSKNHSRRNDDTKPPQLSFTVNSPEVVAVVTIGTIPKLMSYTNKFKANLDAQRQGASRESQTFRVTRTPKPENPLSAVAEAMLHSARSRFKEAESDLAFIIQQHMSLRLGFLRLAVFPRTMRDLEVAQFTGRDVAARLDGTVGSGTVPSKRDLQLSFSSMIISKYTQVVHEPPSSPQGVDEHGAREWLTRIFKDANEATIVGLPSMMMNMTSEEANDESSRILVYDFHSEFVRRVGMKAFEDIYITLNMSLYAWLTVLRKNLAREMEQVRATEDWRTSMSSVSTALANAGSQRKKKVPEPLSLTDVSRSATLPSASTVSLSPPGPSSARYTWTDQNRTPQTSRDQYLSPRGQVTPTLQFPSSQENPEDQPVSQAPPKRRTVTYQPRNRHIERLTMRQLGDATPDVMHPFFMKKAGFSLEDSLPQYVHEYATAPLEEIMDVLMKLYSQQLLTGAQKARRSSSDET